MLNLVKKSYFALKFFHLVFAAFWVDCGLVMLYLFLLRIQDNSYAMMTAIQNLNMNWVSKKSSDFEVIWRETKNWTVLPENWRTDEVFRGFSQAASTVGFS